MTVLLDTNVLLDYLQARTDFQSAEKIINLCADKKLTGFMAAHSVPDMYYILRKFFSDSARRDMILSLIDIAPVAEINHAKIVSALANINFSDFEDCLQDECAVAVFADYIITRNTQDFAQSAVSAITPDDFLALSTITTLQ